MRSASARQVMAALDKAMERAQKSQRDAAAGQHGLFGHVRPMSLRQRSQRSEDALPAAPEWDEHTRLQNEKEVLGFFVSGHPMDQVSREAAESEGGRHGDCVRDEAGAGRCSRAGKRSRRTRFRLPA